MIIFKREIKYSCLKSFKIRGINRSCSITYHITDFNGRTNEMIRKILYLMNEIYYKKNLSVKLKRADK